MKANELRIGNILQLADGTYFAVPVEAFSNPVFWENLKELYLPVVLDKEWLHKFGFSEPEAGLFQHPELPGMQLKAGEGAVELSLSDAPLFRRTLFVHRFQNLVFELFEKELVVTETRDTLGEAIRMVADGILYQYIPSDGLQNKLSFKLSIEGTQYRVNYGKDPSGFWKFLSYLHDE